MPFNAQDMAADHGELFVAYLKERLALVEARLSEVRGHALVQSNAGAKLSVKDDLEHYLYEPLARFSLGGGKRVRPILALLGAEAVGADSHLGLVWGIAIELFQSAALIHDDIADKSELRRGTPCLHMSEGVGLAINMGDLALVQVVEHVLKNTQLDSAFKLRILEGLIKMERHTLEGQALDLGWARDNRWDISEDEYLYMVTSKTAYYSAAYPLSLGATAAGAEEAVVSKLHDIGIHAGAAFQLQDDLLNLVGDADVQGKDFRSDITEGKRTLAVVSALTHLNGSKKDRLIELLEAHTAEATLLQEAAELIEEGGGLLRCKEVAQKEAALAQKLTQELAQDNKISYDASRVLISMANFFIERKN